MTSELWRRIEELYHEARECGLDERRAVLAKACGNVAELRRQIELLLDQDLTGGKILDHPAADLLDSSVLLASGTQLGPLRARTADRRGRHGRGVSGHRYAAGPRGRD